MVRNVRLLYNKLGTVDISGIGNGTVSSGLNTVQSELNGKADEGHTHGVGDLPVSNSQVNSTSHVPSSSVAYSLNTLINELGTEINEIYNSGMKADDDPNTRYESVSIGTWSSPSDVDTFLSKYTHNNGYYDFFTGTGALKLGNYVTIQDGTYNTQWEIAGFDMEHNQTAADGTIYDNGYGICMIPKTHVGEGQWNTSDTTSGGYISSYMHNTVLPDIVTKLKNVLGDHIVNRNVLLSSKVTDGKSSAYTWTTAYATLMSRGQIDGLFASSYTKYDDGEANYMLPLFNYEEFKTGSNFWLRGIRKSTSALITYYGGSFGYQATSSSSGYTIRPLIYIR